MQNDSSNFRNSIPSFRQGFFLLSSLLIFLVPLVIQYTHEDNLPPLKMFVRYVILTIYCVVFLGYLYWIKDKNIKLREPAAWLLFFLIAAGLCYMRPVFSGDMMYYLMRGRILGTYHASPYLHTPSEYPNDILRPYDTWPNQTDAYGPLSVYLQTLPTLVFPDQIDGMVWFYKFTLLLIFAPSVYFFYQIVKKYKKDNIVWLLYAYSPFILVNIVVDGHNDIALMSFSVISIYFLLSKKYGRAFLFWTIAFAFKYMVFLILPVYILFILKNEDPRSLKLWRALLVYFLLSLLFLVLLYAPIWGGLKTFEPLLKAGNWFYNSSIPYAFQKGLGLIGVHLHWMVVKYIFLISYVFVYFLFLYRYLLSPPTNHLLIFRCFAVTYLGFYSMLISPLMAWYWLWAFPWLILSGWPKTTLLATLYSVVALLAFYKRINYLTIIACGIYFGAILLATFFPNNSKPARSNP